MSGRTIRAALKCAALHSAMISGASSLVGSMATHCSRYVSALSSSSCQYRAVPIR